MAESASEITEKVNTKMQEFESRFERMEEDYEIWDMQETSATIDYDQGKNKAVSSTRRDNDIHVISNDLRTFADQVQSTLSNAEMQIMVRMAEQEGDDKRADIGKLERLLRFGLDMADIRLRKQVMPVLVDSTVWFSINRGWADARVLVYKTKSGDVIFDILPQDPRWLAFETGGDGLLWTGYKTFRSGAALKDEWGYTEGAKQNNEVIDYWRQIDDGVFENAVVNKGNFVKPPTKYKMRSFPEVIVPVATRPPLASSNNNSTEMVKGYGDSIYAPARKINRTWNRVASIVATHANILSKQPTINYYDEQGEIIKSTVYLAEYVKNLPMGHNELKEAPMKDISPAVAGLLGMLSQQKERAMLPNAPIGSPPPSGTLYNLVQEAGNKIFNPQIKNLNYFYEEICRLIEEQLIDSNIKVDVKYEEKKKYFETKVTPVDLKKPHMIKVEFTARTPWTQFDTYQIADMAKRLGLPDAFVHEFILKLPDPKGLGDMNAIEMAEHSPKMAMVRAIQALMTAGRNDEAESVMRDLYALEMSEEQQVATATTPTVTQVSPGMGG
uniref:Portal protein n=1 Tax=viral metagenome TaxID=1070528 RepID=A0A6M3KVF5_9ZZZZ